MLYRIPDYYKDFCCMADRCEDTCCAGWQIGIDPKALESYRRQSGAAGERLRRSVNWRQGTFRQTKEKRCAFLNRDNLCDLYRMLGADSLCRTCRRYPRHVEEFENVREVTLSLSCPGVAQMILSRETPTAFLSYEKDGTEHFDGFDALLYEKLCNAREAMRGILQSRDLEPELRIGLVLGLAHDMQGRIYRDELESCDQMFARYQSGRAAERMRQRQKKAACVSDGGSFKGMKDDFRTTKRLFAGLHELEQIQDGWKEQLRETEQILFGKGVSEYGRLHLAFARWMKQFMPKWEIQWEQLLIYFMDTYFCGAVYDGRAYGKMQLAAGSVWLIYEMLLARWVKNKALLEQADIVRTAYRYSREIEHSDRNLELLEQQMRVMTHQRTCRKCWE